MSGLPEHSRSDRHLDVIRFDEAETFPGPFQQRVARTRNANAYHQYDAGDGVWTACNWKLVAALVACRQAALDKEGLAAGLPVTPARAISVESLMSQATKFGAVVRSGPERSD